MTAYAVFFCDSECCSVDADAVLAMALSPKRLQAIAWWDLRVCGKTVRAVAVFPPER